MTLWQGGRMHVRKVSRKIPACAQIEKMSYISKGKGGTAERFYSIIAH